MSLPTIRRWWAGHWQILGCPCHGPNGKHAFPTHAAAVQHISDTYATNWHYRMTLHNRAIQRFFLGLPLKPKHDGRSFTKENK